MLGLDLPGAPLVAVVWTDGIPESLTLDLK